MSKFSSEENKQFWNEFAIKSKDNKFGASGGRHLVEIEDHFILSELENLKPHSMLDIGCGNGQRTLLFSKYVSDKIHGIDYSEKMIDEANRLLSKQSEDICKKLSFETADINNFSKSETYDVIISCRCIINQTSHENQLKLFESLHKRLNNGGSLILAEISKQGMERLNLLRNKFGLPIMKPRWHNLHIDEEYIFPKISNLFSTVKLKRAGAFYFISRILYPSIVFPEEPQAESKINEIAMKSENILNEVNPENNFDNLGAHFLAHFKKI